MTPAMIESFRKTRPWVLFLGILGFIFTGIMILALLSVPLTGKWGSQSGGVAVGLLALLFQIVAAVFVYLMPAVLLCRYAGRIRDLLAAPNETAALESAIGAQRSFWRYTGILALVAVCIAVVAIVIISIAAVASLSK